MKSIIRMIIIHLIPILSFGQSMKWIPLDYNEKIGNCESKTNCYTRNFCYALEYIPGTSGTLTSYTTGFFVDCLNGNNVVTLNKSCSTSDNSLVTDGCRGMNKILINASGQSGAQNIGQLQKGLPVILHQVCFQAPTDDLITISEDEITNLTVSIDKENGTGSIAESPAYTLYRTKMESPCQVRPVVSLTGFEYGDRISKLIWSSNMGNENTIFEVERSIQGAAFEPLYKFSVKGDFISGHEFEYIDSTAHLGKNSYRICQMNDHVKNAYSEVREVTFLPNSLKASVSPNPASKELQIAVTSHEKEYSLRILDISGKIMIKENFATDLRSTVDITNLANGLYIIILECGKERYTDKIVVSRYE